MYPLWLFRTPPIIPRSGYAGDITQNCDAQEIVVPPGHLTDDQVFLLGRNVYIDHFRSSRPAAIIFFTNSNS